MLIHDCISLPYNLTLTYCCCRYCLCCDEFISSSQPNLTDFLRYRFGVIFRGIASLSSSAALIDRSHLNSTHVEVVDLRGKIIWRGHCLFCHHACTAASIDDMTPQTTLSKHTNKKRPRLAIRIRRGSAKKYKYCRETAILGQYFLLTVAVDRHYILILRNKS